MKRPYEKPIVMKLQSKLMNKFGIGAGSARKVRKTIETARISDLVERFGSPLFVYSERALRRRFHQLKSAFTTRYPHVTFGWSYKRQVRQLGGSARPNPGLGSERQAPVAEGESRKV